jgi:outer membrane immunogenic protein
MKAIGLARAALLAGVTLPVFGSLPARSADMPIKAPPATASASWSGFYIGGHLGYGYAVTETKLPDFGFSSRFVGLGSRGLTGGALGGYNVMLSSRWLAGVEGDISWQSIRHRGNDFGATEELSLDWSVSIRGRLGYLVTPTTLLFGAVGWTWSEVKFSDNVIPESFSQNVSGVQVGFGIETVLAGHWLARTEYLHSFYGDVQFNTQELGHVSFSPWVGVVRSALIYRMGPDRAMPWSDRSVNPIWAGLYVGGLIGPGIANAKISGPGQPLSLDGLGIAGVLPVVLAGYNVQLAPRWIGGIEGEISPTIAISDVEVEWSGAVRARLGYLLTPATMVYGNVGWGTAGIRPINLSGSFVGDLVDRINGFGWGAGIEAALTERWRARADFQSFVTESVSFTLPRQAAVAEVRARGQAARLGVIYQLGGP